LNLLVWNKKVSIWSSTFTDLPTKPSEHAQSLVVSMVRWTFCKLPHSPPPTPQKKTTTKKKNKKNNKKNNKLITNETIGSVVTRTKYVQNMYKICTKYVQVNL
jgi:hypothetical protein